MTVETSVDESALKFVVCDTGVGIEAERIEELFTAFNKVMRYRNLNKEGVGLGLTICKNLTVALGGDIKVESCIGEGTRFSVIFPISHI